MTILAILGDSALPTSEFQESSFLRHNPSLSLYMGADYPDLSNPSTFCPFSPGLLREESSKNRHNPGPPSSREASYPGPGSCLEPRLFFRDTAPRGAGMDDAVTLVVVLVYPGV